MALIMVRVTEGGLEISEAALQELGLRPGTEAQVEIRHIPGATEIRHAAMRYCWRKLGDAVGAELPTWDGETWSVLLKVKGHRGIFGRLVFSREGEVLVERSSTRQDLLDAVHAASTPASST